MSETEPALPGGLLLCSSPSESPASLGSALWGLGAHLESLKRGLTPAFSLSLACIRHRS